MQLQTWCFSQDERERHLNLTYPPFKLNGHELLLFKLFSSFQSVNSPTEIPAPSWKLSMKTAPKKTFALWYSSYIVLMLSKNKYHVSIFVHGFFNRRDSSGFFYYLHGCVFAEISAIVLRPHKVIKGHHLAIAYSMRSMTSTWHTLHTLMRN
jgi:hypothetical protein